MTAFVENTGDEFNKSADNHNAFKPNSHGSADGIILEAFEHASSDLWWKDPTIFRTL